MWVNYCKPIDNGYIEPAVKIHDVHISTSYIINM